jgi:two-component system response regulator
VKTVLYIEDNLQDVQLVREAFRECGVPALVESVGNAFLAYRYLSKQSEFSLSPTPDLIILDLNLPVIKGTEILKTIKGEPRWRGIPVVVFTSTQRHDEVDSCRQEGVTVIKKPQTFDDIKSVVRIFFRMASGRQQTG